MIEAMKQVKMFLEHLTTHSWTLDDQKKAIELQRQAIEQAEKREWVGLTDEDVAQFETWYDEEEERKGWVHPKLMANYFEAKFKEKNNDS